MNAGTQARPRRVLAAAAVLAVPALSSCGVGFGAQTDQIYTPTDGQNSLEGTVDVLHALVVSDTPGRGRLIAGLANNDIEEADSLVAVTGAGESEGLTFSLQEGDAEIPAGGLLQLADADAPAVVVTGDEEQLRPGRFVRVTFAFANGEPATLNVPVLEPGSDYADVEIPEATDSSSDPESTDDLVPETEE